MKHTFTGNKTFTVKQKFVIEADTLEQAKSILQKQERNNELDSQWLDHNTNKITVSCPHTLNCGNHTTFVDENDRWFATQ
jgi:hypothetical protein